MSRFLKALRGENHDGIPPIWFMRQAGRYMHAYQEIRSRHSFVELCKTPKLIAEVTMQPIKRFGFDAAIIFSDILFLLEAFGCDVTFLDDKGPHVVPTRELHSFSMSCLEPVYEGIQLVKKQLPCPLLGFSGAPFTLFAYANETKRMESCAESRSLLYQGDYSKVFESLEEAISQHLCNQIAAGCDAVQIFDTWAGTLPPALFHTYVVEPIRRITKRVRKIYPDVPILLFIKGALGRVEDLISTNVTGLSLDWSVDIKQVRSEFKLPLQGNLDPAFLLSALDACREGALQLLSTMKNDPAFVFGLGHGVLPKTPESHVEEVVRLVRSG